jgi:hypothetical protein
VLRASVRGDDGLDDEWVDERAAVGDRPHRTSELFGVCDAVLEKVPPAIHAIPKEREGSPGIIVAAEREQTDPGVARVEHLGDLKTTQATARQDAGIGDDNVRPRLLDRLTQRTSVADHGDHVHPRNRLEDPRDSLAGKQVTIPNHRSNTPIHNRHTHPRLENSGDEG